MPSVLFIEEGIYSAEGNYITMKKPLSMYGAGRGKTTLVGVGLLIQGNKSDGIVEIEDLTIQGAEECGLYAQGGMNVIMRRCSIEECQGGTKKTNPKTGLTYLTKKRRKNPAGAVCAKGADISCEDIQVVGSGLSGMIVQNATITLSGQGTSIHGNVTTGMSDDYGLKTYAILRRFGVTYDSSNIHLVFPLSKEQISTNNGGGGNWGGAGIIDQVDNDGVVLQVL